MPATPLHPFSLNSDPPSPNFSNNPHLDPRDKQTSLPEHPTGVQLLKELKDAPPKDRPLTVRGQKREDTECWLSGA